MTTLPEMPCREFVEHVTDYLEDAMTEADRLRFETHLGECPHCHLYLEQMRTTLRLTGALREQDVPSAGRDELLEAFRRWHDERP